MSIEIISNSMCDVPGCREIIKDGDECYCADCYQAMAKELEELKEAIKEL